MKPLLRLIVLLSVTSLLGCGGSKTPARVAVHGSVMTAEGFIANGTIRFLPQPGTTGPVAITVVKDGLYRFTADDGPYPGDYKAAVNLELDHAELSKLSSTTQQAPRMNWEQLVTVPNASQAIQHLEWKGDADSSAPTKVNTVRRSSRTLIVQCN